MDHQHVEDDAVDQAAAADEVVADEVADPESESDAPGSSSESDAGEMAEGRDAVVLTVAEVQDAYPFPLRRCRAETPCGARPSMGHEEITQLLMHTLTNCNFAPEEKCLEIVQELNSSVGVRRAIHYLSEAVMIKTWLHFLLQNAIDQVWGDTDVVADLYVELHRAETAEAERSEKLLHELNSSMTTVFGVAPCDEVRPVWENAPVWARRLEGDIRERFYFCVNPAQALADLSDVVSAADAQRAAETFLYVCPGATRVW
jgi:hypothetical protein